MPDDPRWPLPAGAEGDPELTFSDGATGRIGENDGHVGVGWVAGFYGLADGRRDLGVEPQSVQRHWPGGWTGSPAPFAVPGRPSTLSPPPTAFTFAGCGNTRPWPV